MLISAFLSFPYSSFLVCSAASQASGVFLAHLKSYLNLLMRLFITKEIGAFKLPRPPAGRKPLPRRARPSWGNLESVKGNIREEDEMMDRLQFIENLEQVVEDDELAALPKTIHLRAWGKGGPAPR